MSKDGSASFLNFEAIFVNRKDERQCAVDLSARLMYNEYEVSL